MSEYEDGTTAEFLVRDICYAKNVEHRVTYLSDYFVILASMIEDDGILPSKDAGIMRIPCHQIHSIKYDADMHPILSGKRKPAKDDLVHPLRPYNLANYDNLELHLPEGYEFMRGK